MSVSRKKPRVLVADPEAPLRRAYAKVLLERGFDVLTAETRESAQGMLRGTAVDVLLCDASLLRSLLSPERAGAQVIALAEGQMIELVEREFGGQLFALLPRTLEPQGGLALLLHSACQLGEARRAAARDDEEEEPLVYVAARARKALRTAIGAPVHAPLLLLGETGSGRRSLARLAFARGGGGRDDLIELSAETLSEAELADALSRSLEQTHLGVLIVGVEALAPVVCERLIEQLRTRPANAGRLLFTGHSKLRAQIKERGFPEELFFRMAASLVEVAPLRDRRDDIPVAAQLFLRSVAEELGHASLRFSRQALVELRQGGWPGNFIELSAVVSRAAGCAGGEVISVGDLGFEAHDAPATAMAIEPYRVAKKAAVSAFEARFVAALVSYAGGNVNQAAAVAELDPANFRRLMRRIVARAEKRPRRAKSK